MKTFVCDENMIITIPIGRLRNAHEGPLLPDKFHCVFKDYYKVFTEKGKPRPLGAGQAITGVLLFTLGLVFRQDANDSIMNYTLPSVLFVIAGLLNYAAGKYPKMHLAKLSFVLNILSFFWSVGGICLSVNSFNGSKELSLTLRGINGLIISLLALENTIALFLIYWLSIAVCRQSFNSLPTILLKCRD